MNESWKENAILEARRKIQKYPYLKEVITLGLTIRLLVFYICNILF